MNKVAAVPIFGFLTQMAHAFIQPACLVREFYLTHFFGLKDIITPSRLNLKI
jgi:hypothetical protein